MYKVCVALCLLTLVAAEKQDEQIWDVTEEVAKGLHDFLTEIKNDTSLENAVNMLSEIQSVLKTTSSNSNVDEGSNSEAVNASVALADLSSKLQNQMFVLYMASEKLENAVREKKMSKSSVQLMLSVVNEAVNISLSLSKLISKIAIEKKLFLIYTENGESLLRFKRAENYHSWEM